MAPCSINTAISTYAASVKCADTPIERRSGNYKPTIWTHRFIQTLKQEEYTVITALICVYIMLEMIVLQKKRIQVVTLDDVIQAQVYVRRADVLRDKVGRHLNLFYANNDSLAVLELIDDLERLGLGYIFEEDIQKVLESILKENKAIIGASLHATALYFRIFRHHGFDVLQGIFKIFQDSQGNFGDHLSEDVKGIVSLFQASYLGKEGENIVDEAKIFAYRHLNNATKRKLDPDYSELVSHALELPLHYRITRLEARWYIDVYSRRKDANSDLLELAKLDYNMVQATFQKDLIDMSRWWDNLGLAKKLPFSRDRLVESFMWSVGMADQPKYNYCRQVITKLVSLINVIDDVYDVYATLEEAKLFTDAVERWDIKAVEELPYYLKLCFFALYNTANEFAYTALKDQGLDILAHLRKKWVDLCKAYLVEAKWFHTGHKPTLDEYLSNGCNSCAAPLVLYHMYVFMTPKITKEALDYLDSDPHILGLPSLILRLNNDLNTCSHEIVRGDNPKAIHCYMKDSGVTEQVSRKYIRLVIDEAWKKLNVELGGGSPLPPAFLKVVFNTMRTAECVYQCGDGRGTPGRETKDRVLSLIVHAIPM